MLMHERCYRVPSLCYDFLRLALCCCFLWSPLSSIAAVDRVVCYWAWNEKLLYYCVGDSVANITEKLRSNCKVLESDISCPLNDYEQSLLSGKDANRHWVGYQYGNLNTNRHEVSIGGGYKGKYSVFGYYSCWTNTSTFSHANASGWFLRSPSLELTRCAQCGGYFSATTKGDCYPFLGANYAAFSSSELGSFLDNKYFAVDGIKTSEGVVTAVTGTNSSTYSASNLGNVNDSNFGGGSSSGGTTVNVDTSGIESRLDTIDSNLTSQGSKLTSINDNLVLQNSKLDSSIDYSASINSRLSQINQHVQSTDIKLRDNVVPSLSSLSTSLSTIDSNFSSFKSIVTHNQLQNNLDTQKALYSIFSLLNYSSDFVPPDLPDDGVDKALDSLTNSALVGESDGQSVSSGVANAVSVLSSSIEGQASRADGLLTSLNTLSGNWQSVSRTVPHYDLDFDLMGDSYHFVLDFSDFTTLISWFRSICVIALWLVFIVKYYHLILRVMGWYK